MESRTLNGRADSLGTLAPRLQMQGTELPSELYMTCHTWTVRVLGFARRPEY